MADLKELTAEMDRFVAAKGWYGENTRRQQSARNIAISLCIEAAEVLEHFQWSEQTKDPGELAGELADVALYLLQLARISGIDLEEAIHAKLAHNYTRSWDMDERAQTDRPSEEMDEG